MILGFSNILRNSTPFYYVDLPSFQRDFAALKTLDHGTGPAITFTRASDATYFDANGVLQTAINNVPRFDHDPATGASRGLLIEEARTNSIRNSQAGGGGTLPNNWTASSTLNNVTRTIVGVGTENGLSYLEIQYAGTPTTTSAVTIGFDSTTQVVAANGQAWSGSAYCRLVGGSLSNSTVALLTSGRDASGNSVAAQSTNTPITPTSAALASQRFSSVVTFSSASVERVMSFITIAYTSGNPIDLTLRIAAPQLEQGAFPTSYIPTTSAAATRSADSAVVTPISSFYNQAEGTLFAEWNTPVGNVGIVAISDNSSLNRFAILNTTSTLVPNGNVRVDNVAQCSITVGAAATASDILKFVLAAKVDDFQAARGGVLGTADTSGTLPTLTHLRLGAAGSFSNLINGHIRKVAYYPKRLSNALLQQLTT